jgi:hypothetical protein
MSEFQCVNLHLMRSAERRCKICGLPMRYMDGKRDEEKGKDYYEYDDYDERNENDADYIIDKEE